MYSVASGAKEAHGCSLDAHEELAVAAVDGPHFVAPSSEEAEGLVLAPVGGQLGGLLGALFVGLEVLP